MCLEIGGGDQAPKSVAIGIAVGQPGYRQRPPPRLDRATAAASNLRPVIERRRHLDDDRGRVAADRRCGIGRGQGIEVQVHSSKGTGISQVGRLVSRVLLAGPDVNQGLTQRRQPFGTGQAGLHFGDERYEPRTRVGSNFNLVQRIAGLFPGSGVFGAGAGFVAEEAGARQQALDPGSASLLLMEQVRDR